MTFCCQAKSAVSWSEKTSFTIDGKRKKEDTFLTACREDSYTHRDDDENSVPEKNFAQKQKKLVGNCKGDIRCTMGKKAGERTSDDRVESQNDERATPGLENQELRGRSMELDEMMKAPGTHHAYFDGSRGSAAFHSNPGAITPKTEFQHGKEYLQNLRCVSTHVSQLCSSRENSVDSIDLQSSW